MKILFKTVLIVLFGERDLNAHLKSDNVKI